MPHRRVTYHRTVEVPVISVFFNGSENNMIRPSMIEKAFLIGCMKAEFSGYFCKIYPAK
jgi:hypothetical protein